MRKAALIFFFQCWLLLSFGQQNIASIEYYFDSDPGLGNAATLTLPSNGSSITSQFSIPTSNLSEGFHSLYLRAKDDDNTFGLYDTRTFYVLKPSQVTITNLVAAEYYFDTDPGLGNASSLTISSAANITDSFNIPIGALAAGFHTLYIRFKNEANSWSLVDKRVFYVSESVLSENATITNLEYYFNADLGVGNGTSLTVPENPNNQNIFDITATDLPEGEHLLFIRAKNSQNIWSLSELIAFTVDGTLGVVDNLLKNEFTIYPNAFNEKITINTNHELLDYKMFSSNGKKVIENKFTNNTIEAKNLAKGVYFLVINSKKGKVVKKILKE